MSIALSLLETKLGRGRRSHPDSRLYAFHRAFGFTDPAPDTAIVEHHGFHYCLCSTMGIQPLSRPKRNRFRRGRAVLLTDQAVLATGIGDAPTGINDRLPYNGLLFAFEGQWLNRAGGASLTTEGAVELAVPMTRDQGR
jgi:hypothetical protein